MATGQDRCVPAVPKFPRLWSRRAFLAASGGLMTAAAVGWPELAFAHDDEPKGDWAALVLSSDLYAAPGEQRFAFAMAKGKTRNSFAPVKVAFVPGAISDANPVELNEDAFQPTKLYKKGLSRGRGVYVASAVFDQAGVWTALALTHEQVVPFAIDVKAEAEAPLVGAAAPRAASPTKAERLGVKPICTRRPQCPLHGDSLSEVIGAGRPVAVMFATPARCQSEYCGPVLDEMLDVRKNYDGVTFVHVDIYRNNRTTDLVPTVEEWGLPSEPWMYTIDAGGTIVGRLDGAFGKAEVVQLLDGLTA
jgi:hypothetical protein